MDEQSFEEYIWRQLKAQFGVTKIEGIRLIPSGKQRVRAVSENLFTKLNILNPITAGMYFATIMPDGIRLSVEGSQIVGKRAERNVVELDCEQVKKWLKGENVPIPPEMKGYVIVKDKLKNDFLGCGLAKNGILINFLPKARRTS